MLTLLVQIWPVYNMKWGRCASFWGVPGWKEERDRKKTKKEESDKCDKWYGMWGEGKRDKD